MWEMGRGYAGLRSGRDRSGRFRIRICNFKGRRRGNCGDLGLRRRIRNSCKGRSGSAGRSGRAEYFLHRRRCAGNFAHVNLRRTREPLRNGAPDAVHRASDSAKEPRSRFACRLPVLLRALLHGSASRALLAFKTRPILRVYTRRPLLFFPLPSPMKKCKQNKYSHD